MVKYSMFITLGVVVLFYLFQIFNYDGFGLIKHTFEWATRFILPWIALYWFILLIKSKIASKKDIV